MHKVNILLIVAVFLVSTHVTLCYAIYDDEWEAWKVSHLKTYRSVNEDQFRQKIFIENKEKIDAHNYMASRGKKSYFVKMNHYGDLLQHEFVRMLNGIPIDASPRLSE